MQKLIILYTLLRQASAILDGRPQQTTFDYGFGGNALGFSPMPTGVMRIAVPFLSKREVPDRTCGYIGGNFYNSITCGVTEYCAANTDYGVLGCCTSYSLLPNGEYTFTGCNLKSRCYDFTATDACTGSCADNPLVGSCTNPDFPYCQTFSLTDLGLSGYACNTASGVTYSARLSATTTFSVSPGTANPTAGIEGEPDVSVTGVVFQATATASPSSSKSSVVGPAVGGAIGGLAVVLIAVGGFFWLRMKHNKQKAALAATATTVGPNGGAGPGSGQFNGTVGGAYVANQHKSEYDTLNPGMPGANHQLPPMYTGPAPPPQMAQNNAQGQPQPQPVGSPTLSEMPTGTAAVIPSPQGHYGSKSPQTQTYSEVEGSSQSTAVSSSGVGAAGGQIQRKSVGSNSVLSGSGGDRTELDSTSASGQIHSPISPVAAASAAVVGSSPQQQQQQQQQQQSAQQPQQPGAGFQSGPISDWNRPYHELE